MKPQHIDRRYDLDWLRVIAFSILILFHSGMMFNTWDWHVKNNVTTDSPEMVMYFLHLWRMPLLFLISGAAVYMVMKKFTVLQFLKNRVNRILIPLIFGMFVIVPPQVYFERVFSGQIFNSYFDFYMTVLDFVPYPQGNFTWHHLWYLPYIFTFSVVLLPLFTLLQSQKGSAFMQNFIQRFCGGGMILLWSIPIGIFQVILRPYWPDDQLNLFDDWSNVAWSIMFFLYGFMLVSHKNIWESIERLRVKALFAGIVTFALLIYFIEDFQAMNLFERSVFRMVRALEAWSVIVAILGFARKYLRRNSPLLRYANEAVYPFYILHQTITVALAFYLSNWEVDIVVKFLLVSASTFIGCWILYEGLIKRSTIARMLFGMKPIRHQLREELELGPAVTAQETAR